MNKRFVRIINPIDIYGNSFIPKHIRYEIIWTHEKFVAIGIEGIVLYKIRWEDIEEY